VRGGLIERFASWDAFLAVLTITTLTYAVIAVPNFATAFNVSQAIAGVSERALIVLPMVLLIISREIDLSVASMLALSSVVFGVAVQTGFPLSLAIFAALLTGFAGGAVNGALVTILGLPSLVVTLGTLALFRGVGYIILGSGSVNEFPDAFTDFGIDTVAGTVLPWTIVPFLVLAPIFAVLLQNGAIGRRIYAIGGSPEVARYAGVRVGRVRLALFAASGVISALAGVVFTARLANARADNAVGLELDVITIALLGGVSVFGGRGHLTSVLFALVLIAALRNILGLLQIGGDAQGTVIGQGWSSPKASATSPAPDPPRHDRANAPTLAAPHAAPHPPLLEICPPCPASANQRKDGITPAIRWLHPWNLLSFARLRRLQTGRSAGVQIKPVHRRLA
jgi:rhamnose transport system permease protein